MTQAEAGAVCSRHRPAVRCRLRAAASRRGEFVYWFHARGWTMAVDRKPLGGLPVYTWTFCPWCGGSLPDTESAMDRLLSGHDDEIDSSQD